MFTFTIDPEESTDLDDALSFEEIKSTRSEYYKIGIHISDVAEFVSRGDKVDKEAQKKGLTFYKQGKIHRAMLPKDYTNNYLSLLPDRKRAVISVIFLMDKEGNIVNVPAILDKAKLKPNFELYQISQSIIKSNHNTNTKTATYFILYIVEPTLKGDK